jgi:hypothetical protein
MAREFAELLGDRDNIRDERVELLGRVDELTSELEELRERVEFLGKEPVEGWHGKAVSL